MQCSLISTFIIGSAVYAPPECLYWAVTVTSAAFPASGMQLTRKLTMSDCRCSLPCLMSSDRHQTSLLVQFEITIAVRQFVAEHDHYALCTI